MMASDYDSFIPTSDIETLRECPVCLEQYRDPDKLPKLLPCAHTLCSVCVLRLAGSSGRIQCPLDMAVHGVPKSGVTGFQNNLTVIALVDIDPLQKCTSCKATKRIKPCQHCQRVLCEECKKKHIREAALTLKTSVKQMGTEMKVYTEALNTHTKCVRFVKSQCEMIRKEVTKSFDNLVDRVRARQNMLLNKLDGVTNDDLSRLQQCVDDLESEQACIQSFIDSSVSELGQNKGKDVTESTLVEAQMHVSTYRQDINNARTKSFPEYKIISFMENDELIGARIDAYGHLDKAFRKGTRSQSVSAVDPRTLDSTTNAAAVTPNPERSSRSIQPRPRTGPHRTQSIMGGDAMFQRLRELYTSKHSEKLTIGNGMGENPGEVMNPYGLTMSPCDGRYVLADTGNHRIQMFDDSGRFVGQFGNKGDGPGQFRCPCDVAVSNGGTIFVSDSGNCRIQMFDSNGRRLDSFGSGSQSDEGLGRPWGLALNHRNNQLLVCDAKKNKIRIFSERGIYLRDFVSASSLPGQLHSPYYISVAPSGHVAVSDRKTHQIHMFDSNGEHTLCFGKEGEGDGEFVGPSGVQVDEAGHIIVADQGRGGRVQVFAQDGSFVCCIHTGAGGGAKGLTITDTGDIAVAVGYAGIKTF